MRASNIALISLLTPFAASCSHAYDQHQLQFRERAMTDCRVLNEPPVEPSATPAKLDSARKSQIRDVIEDSHRALGHCYMESLDVWPRLEGNVVINFTVKPDGSVGDTAVAMHHSTVFDAPVGCCIARVARTWKFPAPPDSKSFEVAYPFELLKDNLKVGFSTLDPPSHPFTPQFSPTVVMAPPQSSRGSELHLMW